MDQADKPIWVQDISGTYLRINQPFYELCGQINLVNESINNTIELFDTKTLHQLQQDLIPQIKTLKINQVDYECQLIPYSTSEEIKIIGIVNEAICDKQSKEQLETELTFTKSILDTIPHNIYYKNTKSEYILINEACETFYKKAGVKEVIGKSDLEISPYSPHATAHLETDKQVIETKGAILVNTEFVTNEETTYYEVIKVPLLNKEGEVTGIVGSSRNVTEQKLLEDRLRYLSYTDILTGVYNRTSFEEKVKKSMEFNSLPLGVILGDVNGLKLINDGFGHLEGDQLLKSIANILTDVINERGYVFRWGGDEFVILIPNATEQFCESIVEQITLKCKETKHHLIELSISLGIAIHYDKAEAIFTSLQKAESQVYRHKLLDRHSRTNSTLISLQQTLKEKSMETSLHTSRMVVQVRELGKALGLTHVQLDELELATELHDIGKIGITEDILLKPGPLTDKEYEIIKHHTEKGYRIVKATTGIEEVANAVLHHHERFDGTGYPFGLQGEEIPLYSRIISVVDSYDAMTHTRSYRGALTHEEAIQELIRVKGTQLDCTIVDTFINCI